MKRDASDVLDRWLVDPRRLPLVVRGARQVGKTWLVREFAARQGRALTECNFERDPWLKDAFRSNDPRQILDELAVALGRRVEPEGGLLFLDEIQAAGDVLAKLRWFAEELPELPVIAAGSLLEFTLAAHEFSMPVGRVTYLHVHPLSFPEYLRAHGQSPLLEALAGWVWPVELSQTAFATATKWFARYTMAGGMPAVVRADVDELDTTTVRRLQHDLLATYLDDFSKYAARTDPGLLQAALRSVARQLGQKFVYAAVSEGVRSDRAHRALELLARARVCHIIRQTSANGLPLGGELNARNRKAILLDIGLGHALLGMPSDRLFLQRDELAPHVRGGLAEQILGQQLLALAPPWEEPDLYYWQRGGGRPGEVDYVVQIDARIVPVEAKAGAAGSLKSLHQFVYDKGLELAVRFDANRPSLQRLDLVTTQGNPVRYVLLTLPHFLAWRLTDLVRSASLTAP